MLYGAAGGSKIIQARGVGGEAIARPGLTPITFYRVSQSVREAGTKFPPS